VRIGGRPPPLAPDPELIRRLAELLTETGLSEIEYAVRDHRVRVARNGHAPAAAGPVVGEAPSPDAAAWVPAVADLADHPGLVKAPLVGVAYLAPEPGLPAFVQLGDTVAEGQTLLIIEAMKVMNQISAPRSGRVSRIFIDDVAPVEYGSMLMLIE
jgi:acetyl-CoA carboxylase biotin carboxyl carrier protein